MRDLCVHEVLGKSFYHTLSLIEILITVAHSFFINQCMKCGRFLLASSSSALRTHNIQMQISYPNICKRARAKKNIVSLDRKSLYSHNFILCTESFRFTSSASLWFADNVRRRRRFISLNTRDFVSLLQLLLLLWYSLVRVGVDRLFHTTLITSPVLIWAFLMFNHFNKNVISEQRRARAVGEREKENIFLVVFIWFLHWIYDFARSGFIMHDKRGKPSMRELF